jgi:hypothetical protein
MGGVFNLVNMQMYHYAGNNPLKYTDPDGRDTLDEISGQIADVQNKISQLYDPHTDSFKAGAGPLVEQLTDLKGQYNRAVIEQGDLNIGDYIQNGTLTGGFGTGQGLSGSYQTNSHAGVDGVGGYAKTPFYTNLVDVGTDRSNTLTFEVIGTDLQLQIKHGDAGSFKRTGNTYRPGQAIMLFPQKNNSPPSSTAPHFHFQISNGSQFVDPFTLKASSAAFRFTSDGGKTWKNYSPNF